MYCVSRKIILWDRTLSNLVEVTEVSNEYNLRLQDQIIRTASKQARSNEQAEWESTSLRNVVNFYHITRNHNPQDGILVTHVTMLLLHIDQLHGSV